MCVPPIESGIITLSAPANFSFATDVAWVAREIIFNERFNSRADRTTYKLSASFGKQEITAVALSNLALASTSSSVESPLIKT